MIKFNASPGMVIVATSPSILYIQAPVSMRAMCQAMLLLTIGGGDLIVIIVAESSFFESRVSNSKANFLPMYVWSIA